MRFNENGPDIPDELLIARDEGDVLFFCGAGVSLAFAGLADFLRLAGDVIEELGSLTGSQARRLFDAASTTSPSGFKSFVPVDRMFSSLDLEFDPLEVRGAVARALRPEPDADLTAHKILIDLSRGIDGRPRLITTNFDLLFEKCDAQLKSRGPASLPVPDRPADFEGIIHIHGHVDRDYSGISDAVVLSSGDFGKAYLSDGWATHYIRKLMNRYKIVFIGYSADDPPVQYLLEALREEQSPTTSLYAFQYGDEADAREQWMQKGVTPIAFGSDYSNLWDTLRGWAERARDLSAWHHQTVVDASSGPSQASPVFRGRIAHMASTVVGMAKLASAEPPVPSTWLYTFDPAVRYLRPEPIDRGDLNSGQFDPFEHFGLDRDEPPPPYDPEDDFHKREAPASAWNAFGASKRDLIGIGESELGSIYGHSAIVPRLWSLSLFLIRRMKEAPTLWWAASLRTAHPNLIFELEQELRYRLSDVPGPMPKYWRYLLAFWKEPNREIDQAALEISSRALREGWSPGLVREAVELCRPAISVQRKYGVEPPFNPDDDPAGFITLDVEYPRPHQEFKFDVQHLPLAAELWRGLLADAERMEVEIDAWIELDTTRPDDGGEELSADTYGLTGPLVRFTHLLAALEDGNPEAAAREVIAWEAYTGIVFERLRIWAAGRSALTSSQYAEAIFTKLDDRVFWSSNHERDLFFAIRDRWPDISSSGRKSIEARLLSSPIPYLEMTEAKEARTTAAMVRLSALYWFTQNGVTFSFDLEAEKSRLRALAPAWKDDYAEYTARPKFSGVHSVGTDSDPTSILNLLPSELLPIELPRRRGLDFTEYDPFAGYCAMKPARAILALHSAMRRNVDTTWHYWSTFLRSTSKMKTSARLDTVVVKLIQSLSTDEVAKLWYPLADWLSNRAIVLEARGFGEFDIIWDRIVAAAAVHPSQYKQKPSRDWSFESLNSPIGRLVQALFDIRLPDGQHAVPSQWIVRLTKVLNLPGDHGRHALYHVAMRASWLYHYEPAWTDAHVLSKATVKGPDGDAFWSGFARMGRVPEPAVLQKLKLAMLTRIGKGGRDEHNLVGYLLSGWAGKAAERTVSDQEMRDVLILGDNDVRHAALRFVSDWAAAHQEWMELVLPFVSRVWPKQRTLRTPQLSSELFRFASRLPTLFGPIIHAVSRGLVALSRGHMMHLSCNVDDLDNDGVEALLTALEKLLPEDRTQWPYDGKRIIDELKASGRGLGPRLDRLVLRASEREH